MIRAFFMVMRRELTVAVRRWSDLVMPLVFFIIVCTLFPLAVGQDIEILNDIGPGAIWVAALLATLLSLNTLFRDDFEDGSLEQLVLDKEPLTFLLLAKTVAHWLVTGLPLVVLSPVLVLAFGMPVTAIPGVVLTLLAGTPALSLLGSVGAALTAGLRQASGLLALLLLPLTIPVLIFGARAADMAASGESIVGPLYMLGGISMLALTLTPFATAAAVRVSLD
ncbi:MAG: heme exporter protein CcmB [Chromatiales bacterium]|jgi:heme exporter protein B|nr:heme exporter protein CcmB [Chromatiales bacterium]MDP6149929.1 heme exporter protein CcmB [Gammaproteobacteria bacterium]MDP7271702.1 heme exporter protein CcmB [Gammaproteobacteria bacterium]HJP03831.1 heme exporter protein CcmB [Gammaproteobacteria bacterium]